jgi:crotonobetainyl-CoA:carnitine CoA-transferase CaiB-like acyl-CoA transferase
MIERPTDEWVERLERAGVPCGPVNTIDAVFRDPQVQARGIRFEMAHRGGTAMSMVESPIRLSGTPVQHRLAPPMLGEHTDEVLASRLRLDDAQIAALRASGII